MNKVSLTSGKEKTVIINAGISKRKRLKYETKREANRVIRGMKRGGASYSQIANIKKNIM